MYDRVIFPWVISYCVISEEPDTRLFILITTLEPDPEEEEEEVPVKEEIKTEIKEEPIPELSNIQILVNRQHKLQERKTQIALLASSLIENPEENVSVDRSRIIKS